MSTTSTVPTWPRIEAVARPDGSGEVTINGTSHAVETTDLDAARAAVLALVTETAEKVRRPVRVSTVDPDGTWPLIVHPDGTVEADEDGVIDLADAHEPPAPLEPPAEAPPHGVVRSLAPRSMHMPVPMLTLDAVTVPLPPLPEQVTPESAAAAETAGEPILDGPVAAPYQPLTRREARRSFLEREQPVEPAARGMRGVLARVGIKVNPSAAEVAERADEHAVSQHWPGPRTIAVVNGKGGASKTPTTIALAAVFARYGGAGVLAWDNNQTRGTLGWRTDQCPHEATLLDLLPHVDRLLGVGAQSADLARYVHHQARDKFDVLRSKPMALADEQRITTGDVDALHAVASKYYRLIIIDSGNDESDPMWLRMVDHADQLVVATTTRDDHAEAGALLLEALAERDEHSARLAAGAIAVVSQADPKATRVDVTRVADGYRALARAVVAVPFDSGMVDGVLRYDSLRPGTQRAWLAAGAAVARGL